MKNLKTRAYCVLTIILLVFLDINLKAQDTKDFTLLPKQVAEAKKIGNTKMADSLAQYYINSHLLKLNHDELFTNENLTFISKNLHNTKSKAFKMFLRKTEKVNEILGKDKAEYSLRGVISAEYLKDIENSRPDFDWNSLEKTISSKFGSIGLEELYGKQMIYYLGIKDWNNFGKYYVLYFEKALTRPEYIINDITWDLFENINDPKVLLFACDVVMKYAIMEWYKNDANSWDTYANLLHKTGRTSEAIELEEKVVKKKTGQDDLSLYMDTLAKMRKGLPTWNILTTVK